METPHLNEGIQFISIRKNIYTAHVHLFDQKDFKILIVRSEEKIKYEKNDRLYHVSETKQNDRECIMMDG